MLVVVSAQNVCAMPEGPKTSIWSFDDPFEFRNFDNNPIASVDCDVWKYDAGPYLYAYQITNTSDTHLSFFMMEILDVVEVQTSAFDLDEQSWVAPDMWSVNASGQSVNALFNSNSLDRDEVSALLWYVSDYGPGWGTGTLVGTPAEQAFAMTDLPTPVPEPATLLLLGAGGLLTVFRKRRPV